jgi:GABA permease
MHSPVRSESEVFWGVVLVGAAAVAVALLGLLAGATAALILAGVLIAAGIGALLLRARGSLPQEVEPATASRQAYRILVVANETVGGGELLDEIRAHAQGRDSAEVLVVCPALTGSRLQHIASDTDGARRAAEERLASSLAALRRDGLTAQGTVGDEEPAVAAADALRSFGADELIVSTHPPERSRWLERGVVEQLRREVDLPISHVVVGG